MLKNKTKSEKEGTYINMPAVAKIIRIMQTARVQLDHTRLKRQLPDANAQLGRQQREEAEPTGLRVHHASIPKGGVALLLLLHNRHPWRCCRFRLRLRGLHRRRRRSRW